MEEDIRRRKKMLEIQRMEELIEQNRKVSEREEKKAQDSLEQLQK